METRSTKPVMRYTCLLLTVNDRVAPALLEAAVDRVCHEHAGMHVVIPAVLPPTLPISALPPRMAARLDALGNAARRAAGRLGASARVEVVQCRDVVDALTGTVAGRRFDEIILVGPAGRALRRAAHGETPVTVLSERQSGFRALLPKNGRTRGNPAGRLRVLSDAADAASRGASGTSIPWEGN